MMIENNLENYEADQINEINENNAKLILNPKFIPVYPELLQRGLSITEATIYGFIDFFLSNNDKCYMSNKQFATLLNISEWTVSNSIKKLESEGYIILKKKIKAGGGLIRFINLPKGNNQFYKNKETNFIKMGNPHGIENKIIENKIIENNIYEKSKDFSKTESDLSLETKADSSINSFLNKTNVFDCKEKEKGCGQKEKESGGATPTSVKQLIEGIKEYCISNGLAYDSRYENKYAKAILEDENMAVLYKALNKDVLEFCTGIIGASIHTYKGIVSGPKGIKERYHEIYNETIKKAKDKKDKEEEITFTFSK